MYLVLDMYSETKASSDARYLIGAICRFNFSFSLCVLKFILSNTNALCMYFQGELVDVFNARKKADMQILTLKNCQKEFNLGNGIWETAILISQNVNSWMKKGEQQNVEIQFNEPCLPRECPSD